MHERIEKFDKVETIKIINNRNCRVEFFSYIILCFDREFQKQT